MKLFLSLLVLAAGVAAADESTTQYPPLPPDAPQQFAEFRKQIPKAGLITDAATAVAIGGAVLLEQFGAAAMKDTEPLDAHHERDYWVVEPKRRPSLVFQVGGGPMAVISERDGRVLLLSFTK
jgi:hypothetical protein